MDRHVRKREKDDEERRSRLATFRSLKETQGERTIVLKLDAEVEEIARRVALEQSSKDLCRKVARWWRYRVGIRRIRRQGSTTAQRRPCRS